MRVVFSCDSVPTYPPEVRYPCCAPPPRKAVLSVNGRSPDENGDVDLRKDFAGLLPGDDMTLGEVGSKVSEVVRKLNPGAEPGPGHGGPAEPYGPDTVLGDVRPSSTLKEISDAVPSFSPDGKLPVKALPKYLHEIYFDDPYKADAEAWYSSLAPDAMGVACSAVRRGDRLFRNYDCTFGFAAEFVVRMSAADGRHASVGVASLGEALAEDEAASGVYTSKFRALPGMTLDGINDAGVVAEINVDGGPKTNWHGSGDGSIHILAAVRWVLDHGETAAQAAAYVADHVRKPEGDVNFHFMIADAASTYIVENGEAHDVTDGKKILTNYALYDDGHAGGGHERYRLLDDGADISAVNFTNAYLDGNDWDSDFDSPEQHADAIRQWADHGEDKEAHRGKTSGDGKSWRQTVHTAEYDFVSKTMNVAVQEGLERFSFAAGVPGTELDDEVTQTSVNGVKSSGIWAWVKSLLPSWLTAESEEPPTKKEVDAKRDLTDFDENYTTFPSGDVRPEDFPYITWHLSDIDLEWDGVGIYWHSEQNVFVIQYRGSGRFEFSSSYGSAEWGGYPPGGSMTVETDAGMTFTLQASMPGTRKLTRTANLTAGGLAKFGADGVLEKAAASSAGGEAADYRDPTDNVCHKTEFTEWTLTYSDGVDHHFDASKISYYEGNWHFDGDNAYGDQYRDENATEISTNALFYENNGYKITATRSAVATKDKPFVTSDIAARSLECGEGDAKQTVSVENGVAKLDGFFGESNSLMTGTIAAKSIPAFSSSSTYEVGEIVIYDGVAYKCVTAITPAEEWTAAHWTLATNSDLAARLKGLKSDGTATDEFVTSILGKQVAKEAIDEEIIEKGTAPDAHLEAPTDERLKLILADSSVAYDSAKALPYKLTSAIGDRVIATMTLTAASTDITLPTIAANDTTVKDFILDVTNAYAVEGVATDAGINIPRTDFKLVTRDGESLTDVTTVKAGKSAFLCFTQKAPVVVGGTTYPCWCVIQLPFGDPS